MSSPKTSTFSFGVLNQSRIIKHSRKPYTKRQVHLVPARLTASVAAPACLGISRLCKFSEDHASRVRFIASRSAARRDQRWAISKKLSFKAGFVVADAMAKQSLARCEHSPGSPDMGKTPVLMLPVCLSRIAYSCPSQSRPRASLPQRDLSLSEGGSMTPGAPRGVSRLLPLELPDHLRRCERIFWALPCCLGYSAERGKRVDGLCSTLISVSRTQRCAQIGGTNGYETERGEARRHRSRGGSFRGRITPVRGTKR
jgi:hypothetical protein